MKRFHVNVSVAHLEQSIEFYRTLFGDDRVLEQGSKPKQKSRCCA
ncbi:MAG: hypothetical protein OER22_13275 [Gammaproteobacteria bacterium]|nr:hypothetical protein [Gammaproteobacteria bacterium]MDH3553584.1 hypothetical protein [Gammaproteobacteria bacterium]